MRKKIRTFDELMADEEYVLPELRTEIEVEVELITKLIQAREEKGLTQRELAELSGIKQPSIARTEKMETTPQIDTLLRLLRPLGYTIQIVPVEEKTKGMIKVL